MPVANALREFLKLEAAGGIVLALAALVALVLANSPLAPVYDALLELPGAVAIGGFEIRKPLLLWLNDGWMAVFFFLVGLEIKRELVEGELSDLRAAALPIIAAIGGMAIPALIYAAINWGDAVALRGWAIPSATDIAFSLGVMSLLGPRVPLALKVMLTAIAIIDDLGAIIIIAVFYTADLSLTALGLAGLGIAGLVVLNLAGVRSIVPYALLGAFMWVCVLKSGVHATLAGVALAFAIPLKVAGPREETPLRRCEHALHPWVTFFIMPIFAFANAGVALAGVGIDTLLQPVTLGIAGGLFIGKQLGVMLVAVLGAACGLFRLPERVNWAQMYGASVLTGIGFTMSLFIGTLAFAGPEAAAPLRLGVLAGSILSAVLGYVVLRLAPASTEAPEPR